MELSCKRIRWKKVHIGVRVRCVFNFCYCQPFHHRSNKLEILINRHLIFAASYLPVISFALEKCCVLIFSSIFFFFCILQRWKNEGHGRKWQKLLVSLFSAPKNYRPLTAAIIFLNALNRRLICIKCLLTNRRILSFAAWQKNWRSNSS